jgi:hypothetical protein
MTPNPSTGLVTLPEVITGELTGKFGEISLYNQHANFKFGSASNSNSTSPWAIACEPATEPSCLDFPLHEHFPYDLCNTSKAHAKALTARWPARRSSPATPRTPTPTPATTQTPPTSSTSARTPSPCPRTPRLSNRCQDQLLARLQACSPDRRELTLRCLPRLASLPGGNTTSSSEGAHFNRGGTTDSGLGTLDRQVFMAVGDTPGPSGTCPDRYFEDILEDKLSANAPADETSDDKNARRECNKKWNERRRCLRESLPIRNLTEAHDQDENRVHTTPEQCLMSITPIAR